MPDFVWPLLFLALLGLMCWVEAWQARRNRRNWRALRNYDEHAARDATRPLGNLDRRF